MGNQLLVHLAHTLSATLEISLPPSIHVSIHPSLPPSLSLSLADKIFRSQNAQGIPAANQNTLVQLSTCANLSRCQPALHLPCCFISSACPRPKSQSYQRQLCRPSDSKLKPGHRCFPRAWGRPQKILRQQQTPVGACSSAQSQTGTTHGTPLRFSCDSEQIGTTHVFRRAQLLLRALRGDGGAVGAAHPSELVRVRGRAAGRRSAGGGGDI